MNNITIFRRKIILICVLILAVAVFLKTETNKNERTDLTRIEQDGLIKVGIKLSPIAFFETGDNTFDGYDYSLIKTYAQANHLELDLHLMASEESLLSALKLGQIDMIAYPMAQSVDTTSDIAFLPDFRVESSVLVQRYSKHPVVLGRGLQGKKVAYVAHSQTETNLRQSAFLEDTTIRFERCFNQTELQLTEDVARGKIDYAIVTASTAKMVQKKLHVIQGSLKMSPEYATSWATRANSVDLNLSLAHFLQLENDTARQKLEASYTYYASNNALLKKMKPLKQFKGYISPYDVLFQRYAQELGWDWKMLAALSWNESHFNPNAESSSGALGMMQMMPRTYRHYGLDHETVQSPKNAIEAGVKYLNYLNRLFSDVTDQHERIKFILASYNGGPGHVLDAMRLAQKNGKNPHLWYGHVDTYLLKLSSPDYYTDDAVKCGKFRAKYTIRYVNDVFSTYVKYCSHT